MFPSRQALFPSWKLERVRSSLRFKTIIVFDVEPILKVYTSFMQGVIDASLVYDFLNEACHEVRVTKHEHSWKIPLYTDLHKRTRVSFGVGSVSFGVGSGVKGFGGGGEGRRNQFKKIYAKK